MTELNDRMDMISEKLLCLEQLIRCGVLKKLRNKVCGDLTVETIYDDETSVVVIEKGLKGQSFPQHIHKGCIQFLICVKGKFSVDVPSENLTRILKTKGCFTVGESVPHSVHCLEDNSKLIGVVIPTEPMYRTK